MDIKLFSLYLTSLFLFKGLNAGLAPMYLTEISPIHLRGAVGTIYQLIIAFSILVSQILGLPEILGTYEGWPILFGMYIFLHEKNDFSSI